MPHDPATSSSNSAPAHSSASSSSSDLFPAHAAALAANLAAENEASQRSINLKEKIQSENTKKTYKMPRKAFLEWCAKVYRYETSPGVFEVDEKVSEDKLIRFLDEVVVPAGKKRPHEEGEPLGYESYQNYLKSIMDLYKEQCLAGENHHPNPRGEKLKNWRKEKLVNDRETKRARFDDRGAGTLSDGYNFDEMLTVSRYFFDRATGAELRNRATFLIHHMMLLRGDSSRYAELADLLCVQFPDDDGYTPCPVLVYHTEFGKTATPGVQEYYGTIRHKNVETCAFGALAFYFFYRFHCSDEDFPNFTRNQDWYGIKMLVGRDKMEKMAYQTQHNAIKRAFEACNVISLHTTHSGRGSGARAAEMNGATEDQLRRHGGWNMQSMERHYLSKLPKASIRAVNGFPADHGHFWLRRAVKEPNESLKRKVFPDVDDWLRRVESGDGAARSISAQGFLNLLKTMRTIFLQDAVMMRRLYPTHPIFRDPLFSDQEYRDFEASLLNASDTMQQPADIGINNVLPRVGQRLDAIDARIEMHHRLTIEALRRENQELREQMSAMMTTVNQFASGHFRFHPGPDVEPQGSALGSSTQQHPAASSENVTDGPPSYEIDMTIKKVIDVWNEYHHGIGDQPATSHLEEEWGTVWRRKAYVTKRFTRRLKVIKAIEDIAEQRADIHGNVAAAELLQREMSRRNWSLNQLINDLYKNEPSSLTELRVTKSFQ